MDRIWDHLMRRKGLLGLVLLVSAVSSLVSYRLLSQTRTAPDHTYITIANWGEDAEANGELSGSLQLADDESELSGALAVEIPRTGGESPAPSTSVLSPREVVLLPAPAEVSDAEEAAPANQEEITLDSEPASPEPSTDSADGEAVAPDASLEDVPDVAPEEAEPDLDSADVIIALGELALDDTTSISADSVVDTPDIPLVGEVIDDSSTALSGGTLNIFLSAVSFLLIVLFAYLIYQHFYR